jgi:orotate phosphoribosyltransferase
MGVSSSAPMTKPELAKRIGERCRLTGQFRLRSGLVSSSYFDKYLFESDPVLLDAVAAHLVDLLQPSAEVLAGLELGGVPVATALSLRTGLPVAFVRKAAKPYGTAKLAEGAEIVGRQVVVIEDVVTTGGQAAASAGELRDRGALVDTVVCVVDRSDGQHAVLHGAVLVRRAGLWHRRAEFVVTHTACAASAAARRAAR